MCPIQRLIYIIFCPNIENITYIFKCFMNKNLNSLSFFKDYELIGKGHCTYVNGGYLQNCWLFSKSQRECEWECSSFDECLGYQYYYYGHMDRVECSLFPSKNTFTKCPYADEDNDRLQNLKGYTMAEIVEELVEGPYDNSVYADACYRRITKNKLQSR